MPATDRAVAQVALPAVPRQDAGLSRIRVVAQPEIRWSAVVSVARVPDALVEVSKVSAGDT
jgi:hypothetical protein